MRETSMDFSNHDNPQILNLEEAETVKGEALILRVGKAKPQSKAGCGDLASVVAMETVEHLNYLEKQYV